MRLSKTALASALLLLLVAPAAADYVNYESSQVHPLALTPSGNRLLAVNTPDARLEVFDIQPGGELSWTASIPVGLEPVSVAARADDEAWVVNQLSDSVSIVDLNLGLVVETLDTGDEPTDVTFANGKAFVAVAGDDAIEVFDAGSPGLGSTSIPVFSRKPRALAASSDGSSVYAVALFSGSETTIVGSGEIFGSGANLDRNRLADLGLNAPECDGTPPPYPPLPVGISRNPSLTDPLDGIPRVGLIVRWNESTGRWEDDAGQDWTACLPFRLPDHDLFVIDTTTLNVSEVDHLGTTLFDVSVNPANGKIYVPNTQARNFVRFEHPLGVRGHVVDNRLSIVDPGNAFSVQIVDLNQHIDRNSDPETNLAERLASISQPGMMAWNDAGTVAWLTAIGSRKVFRVDGNCSSGSCIFGSNRAAPSAVEVGEGPTGVVLYEDESSERLYVLNRFSNSIAVVDPVGMVKLDELALHDPSSQTIKQGRRLLYDAIISSGHGDAACSSCHISGDRDDLAWDLGDPEGEFASYAQPMDNVRFIVPFNDEPADCDPAVCAAHAGFDPQKGPMTTQTLRGMLEPLHWRGDRPTMNDFNGAFVGLLGAADIGPINGKSAGLSAEEMEQFRQFALGIRFPPNPHRNLDDTLPNTDVVVRGSPVPGNPTMGQTIYDTFSTDAGQPCRSCHAHPFGAAGGTLGGVMPAEPTSGAAAAMFNGNADLSLHSDLKVPHLRNMYEKVGPTFGDHINPPPEAPTGFGFTHDGAIPDMATFLSFSVFTLNAEQVADLSSFVLHFPTGTKPAVGRQLSLPAGTPPTGTTEQESVLATLLVLGDSGAPDRHCELVATTRMNDRIRTFHLSGGAWITDVGGETPLTTTELREQAQGPVSFLCATLGSGVRLGGDRDEDAVLDGDDCAAADPETWAAPQQASNLVVSRPGATRLSWDELASSSGPGVRYEILGGSLADLRGSGIEMSTTCVASAVAQPQFDDTRADPDPGQGIYYLVRGRNACDVGAVGAGREALDTLQCSTP